MALNGIRRTARTGTYALARALGYEIVRRHFYSPVPDLDSLSPEVWTRRSELRGVSFDVDAGLRFLRAELGELIAEYRPPAAPTGNPGDYYLDNGFYEALDAHTLYAMVCRFRPKVVLELGSGMSSLVIADALRAAGGDSQHTIYDPYPRTDLAPTLQAVAELRSSSAIELPDSELQRLHPGDFLFVDTSHTVKIGGEVNHVILDVLPALAPGVIVHIHDIYLPWEYPREFMEVRRFYWSEQYLLQAFLAFNEAFEVLFANYALWRSHEDELRALVGGELPPRHPSAFWMRRT